MLGLEAITGNTRSPHIGLSIRNISDINICDDGRILKNYISYTNVPAKKIKTIKTYFLITNAQDWITGVR
ncbi:hypothetical protein MKMG_01743 [Methanogenium sp. MK-MG]|nr:hypothetical protein MKMG_01743 [Methanogenium sp. MK-MG]